MTYVKLIADGRKQHLAMTDGLADGLAEGLFDLPKLLVGSEGTLGVVSEATVKLVDTPKATVTALIHFRHLQEVGARLRHRRQDH